MQGHVCAQKDASLCGSKESCRIANKDLMGHLAAHGCCESKCTVSLFQHKSRTIGFTLLDLVVGDFEVEHGNEEDSDHTSQPHQRRSTL